MHQSMLKYNRGGTLMNNIYVKKGNIFTSECQTLVNTVNCDGVMGAGTASTGDVRAVR